jgi:hypothetical protein
MLGYIPSFLDDGDPRPAREQFNDNYVHGGWHPGPQGITIGEDGSLLYPGDPPTQCLAETILHEGTSCPEIVRLYEHAWVAIIQVDGTYEIARMD